MRALKDRIYNGETVHGCWINLGSAVSAEIIGRSGFDWVLIDLEHGAGDLESMYQQVQVLEATEATPIVRIDELSKSRVQRVARSDDPGPAGKDRCSKGSIPPYEIVDGARVAAQTKKSPA
jgi:4-hydroxy-2-oxoheptanedioate aldolase